MVVQDRARKILIVRMSSYGDILHTALAVQLLRRWRPDAHITWLVHTPFDRLVQRIRGIDRVLDTGWWSPEERARYLKSGSR